MIGSEYTVYRREDAETLMLNLEQLKMRGIEPRMRDYYKFIDREIDATGSIDDIVERIYYELECSGWRINVGDVVKLDGRCWFIDASKCVEELPKFEWIT